MEVQPSTPPRKETRWFPPIWMTPVITNPEGSGKAGYMHSSMGTWRSSDIHCRVRHAASMQDWSCSPQLASHLIPKQENKGLTTGGRLILDAQWPSKESVAVSHATQFRALFLWSQLPAVRRQNWASLGHRSLCPFCFYCSCLEPGEGRLSSPAIISPSTTSSQGQASPPTERRAWKTKVRKHVNFRRRNWMMGHWEIPTAEKWGASYTLEGARKTSYLGAISTGRDFKSSLRNKSFPSIVQQGIAVSAVSPWRWPGICGKLNL